MGYSRAGFEVIGVDIEPQRHYPFEFHQADALLLMDDLLDGYPMSGFASGLTLKDFAAIHASPPCQAYSRLAAMHPGRDYPMLIDATRDRLRASGVTYVIENVEGAPLDNPVLLCGSMFGLGVERGYLRRHRLFECSFPALAPVCQHRGVAVGVYGHGGHSGKHRMLYRAEASLAMGIDHMSRDEMAQAIPPAYCEWIGARLMLEVQR